MMQTNNGLSRDAHPMHRACEGRDNANGHLAESALLSPRPWSNQGWALGPGSVLNPALVFRARRVFKLILLTLLGALGLASDLPVLGQTGSDQESGETTAKIIVPIWPDAPGQSAQALADAAKGVDTSDEQSNLVAGATVVRLGHVTRPTLEIFPAPAASHKGAAVVVCPGGGYHILAYDLEGTEVAAWLNRQGITAAVLKYRVPAMEDSEQPRWKNAVADTQRALSVLRHRGQEWNIAPDKIGILGFSAGGHAAALASGEVERQYAAVDPMDDVSARPNFSVLIYPAYLYDEPSNGLAAPMKVSSETNPMFIVHAFDDPVSAQSSLVLASELKKVNVPTELHLFASGGHGYGLRATEEPVTGWTQLCEPWLRRQIEK